MGCSGELQWMVTVYSGWQFALSIIASVIASPVYKGVGEVVGHGF